MCAGMMSWQTGGTGLWSFFFFSRKHSSQTMEHEAEEWSVDKFPDSNVSVQGSKQSYRPLISRAGRFFWVTACLSLNSHQGNPPSDPTAPGKVCLVCFCTYHTPELPMVPVHPKTCVHQSSADVALFKRGLTTNDTESIRGGGVGECCGGC